MSLLAGLISLGVLCSTLACGSGCDAVGCPFPLSVRLTTPLSESGSYEIVIEHDGSTERCTFELDANDPPRGVSQDCAPFFIAFDGSGALTAIEINEAPQQLSVTVLRDGNPARSATLSPEYERQNVNDEGCGTCPVAIESL